MYIQRRRWSDHLCPQSHEFHNNIHNNMNTVPVEEGVGYLARLNIPSDPDVVQRWLHGVERSPRSVGIWFSNSALKQEFKYKLSQTKNTKTPNRLCHIVSSLLRQFVYNFSQSFALPIQTNCVMLFLYWCLLPPVKSKFGGSQLCKAVLWPCVL